MPATVINHRKREIRDLRAQIESIGLSQAERQTIVDVLLNGKTHRQCGNGNPWASMKRLQRARQKARAKGIVIPEPQGGLTPITLAEYNRRSA